MKNDRLQDGGWATVAWFDVHDMGRWSPDRHEYLYVLPQTDADRMALEMRVVLGDDVTILPMVRVSSIEWAPPPDNHLELVDDHAGGQYTLLLDGERVGTLEITTNKVHPSGAHEVRIVGRGRYVEGPNWQPVLSTSIASAMAERETTEVSGR